MKPRFQINSKKLEKELLFRDEEDYIYGINTLALILLQYGCSVWTRLCSKIGYRGRKTGQARKGSGERGWKGA